MALIALLGPTNTGKTHHALERMLEHRSGMIGFPLRLLARENYDKIVRARGADAVALVTGEERIVPPSPSYFLCTVEAMPLDRGVDFLAIDEVQLAADRERGHVFCDRILHARGRSETMLLGAETIKPLLRALVPEAAFISRPRLSTLSYAEPRKLARLPRRTALVAFSIHEVYALAERVRRETGGAAVVFGALSPRTRNAQVALYQAGEVDYLVATDAIGMGLNLDIDHVAFTSLTKFDGLGPRPLRPAEVAQIAGRAGRYVKDGTFGATSEVGDLDPRLVAAVENHRFEPLERLFWRNSDLDFLSLDHLVASLERRPPHPALVRVRDADDHAALLALKGEAEVPRLAREPEAVKLLWDVCQVPDFRKVMTDAHTRLLGQMYRHLRTSPHRLPEDWVARQVDALDRLEGDVDTLLARISGIRTWTYVSHRREWLADPAFWQARTRAVEDRLSDTLHERLTEQFIDRRATVIARLDQDGEEALAEVTDEGEVLVQGLRAGRLQGFRFLPEEGLRERARALLAAANRALRAVVPERVRQLAEDADAAFRLTPTGEITWRGGAVARLAAGESALTPRVEPLPSDLLDPQLKERVRRRGADWLGRHLGTLLAPLQRAREAQATGLARGLVHALLDGLGAVPAREVSAQVRGLLPAERQQLVDAGVSLGRQWVYVGGLYAADALRLRALLWSIKQGSRPLPAPNGRPWLPRDPEVPGAFYQACGYAVLAGYVVRMDRLERLAAAARQASRQGAFALGRELTGAVSATPEEVGPMLRALGYEQDEAGRFVWRVPAAAGEGRRRKRA